VSITISPCTSTEEFAAALGAIWHYFGGVFSPEDAQRWLSLIDLSRMIAARDGASIVGGAGAFGFETAVPGGTVRAAGTTVVGVLPTHRRRGVLRAMMRSHLDDAHARGEPMAYLWASEETIYGRFGYGMAAWSGEIVLPKAAVAFVRDTPLRGELRIVGESEALEPCASVYERVWRDHPGMFARTKEWWTTRRLADPPARRQGGGALNRMVLSVGGVPEAYALYRMHQSFDAGVTAGHVNVLEAVGATPAATREIWRAILDIDWVAEIKATHLPVDHPLFFMLARPRRLKLRLADSLWVRLVDVRAALAARSYREGEPVVLEVTDPFRPENDGRYAIDREGGVERTSADADLAMDVSTLGSLYFGAFGAGMLARAGRLEERRAGASARADARFRWDRAPWCPEIF